MDSRKYKSYELNTQKKQQEAFKDEILGQSDQILPIDQIANDYKYLDATIFNLCQKLELGSKIQDNYFQNQQTSITPLVPKQLKFYIHSSAILPVICSSLAFMKYRKTLNMHKFCLIMCGGSMLNELVKYKKAMELNKELAKQYKEHTEAYGDLMASLMQVMTYKDVLKSIFSIDLAQEHPSSLTNYDSLCVEDFAVNLY